MAILALSQVRVGDAQYYKSREELLRKAYKLIEEGEPVLLAYPSSWSDVNKIIDYLEREGHNPFMIDFSDPQYEYKLARGMVDPAIIVQARYSRLAAGVYKKAHYRISTRKRVGRRELFSNPLKSLVEYLYAPILYNPTSCERLKGCSICVDLCPYYALKGKPPSVVVDACTSCGLCLHVCPVEALSMPRTTVDGVEYYASIISRSLDAGGLVLIVSLRDLGELYEVEHDKLRSPLLVFPVDSIVEVTPYMLARLGLKGLYPVIYAPSLKRIEPRMADVLEEIASIGLAYVAEALNEVVVKTGSVLKPKEDLPGDPRRYVRELVHLTMGEALLSIPASGVVYVDGDKCTLCGACVTPCPTNALEVKGDEGVKLLFKYDNCIACKVCEKSCPEDAITVKWEAKRGLKGMVVEEAYSDIARCISCGAPIGSVKLVEKVEARLKERGVVGSVLESIRLCNSCKAKRVSFHGGV
ncbi:MAG: 4Fe-4S binding protein [Desulfurococcales archaeon]|nr:4Fe-4S binding protein [Desulfurococcales archaeon]